MVILIIGLIVLIGIHCISMAADVRANLIEKYGSRAYMSAYGLISTFGLGLVVWGKSQAEFIGIWQPYGWGRPATLMLMYPALVLLVSGLIPNNWFRRTLGYPMILAIEVWALAHLMANGDLASMLLFGSLFVWALFAYGAACRRKPAEGGKSKWFNNVIVLGAGIILYTALLHGHEWFIGVRLLP